MVIGAAAGFALKRWSLWAAYGLIAPWLAAGLVMGGVAAVRPAREWIADRREASCHAEGRPVCTVREFVARCAQAQSDRGRASALLTKLASAD